MASPSPPPQVTTATQVAVQLSWSADDLADQDKLDTLGPTVAAVNEFVARCATAGQFSRTLGATMLAARLWRRRNSPEGVASFGADAPVYVQRNDPDIGMLLGIGNHAPPVVG